MLRAAAGNAPVAAKKPSGRAQGERLRRDLDESRETVRELSAALSLALDENRRLRLLLPPLPPGRPLRPAIIRLRDR